MTDEELWLKHIEEYPQIKSWSEEKREGARKGFKSGLAEGRKECMEQNKDGTLKPCAVMKDNTTLRSVKENLEKENAELKKEISELKEKLNKKDCEDCVFYAEGDKCNKGVYYASGTSVCNKFVGR